MRMREIKGLWGDSWVVRDSSGMGFWWPKHKPRDKVSCAPKLRSNKIPFLMRDLHGFYYYNISPKASLLIFSLSVYDII